MSAHTPRGISGKSACALNVWRNLQECERSFTAVSPQPLNGQASPRWVIMRSISAGATAIPAEFTRLTISASFALVPSAFPKDWTSHPKPFQSPVHLKFDLGLQPPAIAVFRRFCTLLFFLFFLWKSLIFEELVCIFVLDLDQVNANNEKGLGSLEVEVSPHLVSTPPWESNGTKTDISKLNPCVARRILSI